MRRYSGMLIVQGRENTFAVLDRRRVLQIDSSLTSVKRSVTFSAFAVMVAGAVEPGQAVDCPSSRRRACRRPSGRSTGPSTCRRAALIDSPMCTRRLALAYSYDEQNVAAALHDLERIGHVSGARNARQIALRLGIRFRPAGAVLVALRERLGQVRNLAVAVDDALARRDRRERAELPTESCSASAECASRFQLRSADRLPDAVDVRLAGDARGSRGRRGRACAKLAASRAQPPLRTPVARAVVRAPRDEPLEGSRASRDERSARHITRRSRQARTR